MSSARSMIGVTISWYANRVATSAAARSAARHNGRSWGRMSRTPRTALIGSERGMEQRLYEGLRNRSRARLVSLAQMPADITALIQLVSLILAAFALVMGAYLLIIGRRPWRGEQDEGVAPRVRLLGLSYIPVVRSAMVPMRIQPHPLAVDLPGGLNG